jgi:UDP-glucose 4-epimerase
MKILIIGGAGFLGTNLVYRCLKEPKNKVTVIDSLDRRLKSTTKHLKPVWSKIEFIKGDFRDRRLMSRMVKDQQVIFNCAGQTSHPLSLRNPFFDAKVNSLGNLTLLEMIRKHNRKALVIYPSSSTVVGKVTSEVIDETTPEFPRDIYSANKAVAEKYYFIYHQVYGLKTLMLRFANLYGPYGKGYPEFGFVNYFISQAAQNKRIAIFGEGNQTRNVMFIGDAVNLLYHCLSQKHLFGNVYFAVHPRHYSVLIVAREVVSVFGKGKIVKVKWPELRKRIEIGRVKISGQKLYNQAKWRPKYSLRKGLKETKKIMERSTK